MTILNVLCDRSRVIVAMDTLALGPDGPAEMSKFMLVPHSNILVCGRGFAGGIFDVFHHARDFQWSFDELKERAQAVFEKAIVSLRVESPAAYEHLFAIQQTQTLIVAGWSESEGAMQAVRIQQGAKSFQRQRLSGECFMPGFSEPVDAPGTDEEMRTLAEYQVRGIREQHPEFPAGGRLLIADMTRGQTTVRDAGKLG